MITKKDDILGTLIHDVAHLLRLDIDRRVKDHNLTRIQWLGLGVIDQNEGLTQTELAAELELGSAAVGRLVDRLVQRGFVKRTPDPDDRRAYHLYLTGEAVALVNELQGTAATLREEILSELSDHEVLTLNQGLNRLKSSLRRRSAACFLPLLPVVPAVSISGLSYSVLSHSMMSRSVKPETIGDLEIMAVLFSAL